MTMDHHIYAIRDRLIDYFQTPFVAAGDKQVMASLATLINDKEATHAVAQAPHHFEIWKIGTITEDGYLTPTRQLLADCASFVRRDVRNGAAPGNGEVPRPMERGQAQTANSVNGIATHES